VEVVGLVHYDELPADPVLAGVLVGAAAGAPAERGILRGPSRKSLHYVGRPLVGGVQLHRLPAHIAGESVSGARFADSWTSV
jgi:hypothetical protein